MKLNFNEWKEGVDMDLIPESIFEVQQLLKFAKNHKKEPASVTFNFSGEMRLNIFHKKINGNIQENFIRRK